MISQVLRFDLLMPLPELPLTSSTIWTTFVPFAATQRRLPVIRRVMELSAIVGIRASNVIHLKILKATTARADANLPPTVNEMDNCSKMLYERNMLATAKSGE